MPTAAEIQVARGRYYTFTSTIHITNTTSQTLRSPEKTGLSETSIYQWQNIWTYKISLHQCHPKVLPSCITNCPTYHYYHPPESPKDPLPKIAKSNVIYHFKCGCGSSYIGKTTRRFGDRMKEHIPPWIQKKQTYPPRSNRPPFQCDSQTPPVLLYLWCLKDWKQLLHPCCRLPWSLRNTGSTRDCHQEARPLCSERVYDTIGTPLAKESVLS